LEANIAFDEQSLGTLVLETSSLLSKPPGERTAHH